jgi:hypothetical protein
MYVRKFRRGYRSETLQVSSLDLRSPIYDSPIKSRQGHLRQSIPFTTTSANPTLIMSTDLALQIGSLIGVSALLYLVTTPRKDLLDQVEEPALSGMRRYSSYHRIRFYKSMSSSNANSS